MADFPESFGEAAKALSGEADGLFEPLKKGLNEAAAEAGEVSIRNIPTTIPGSTEPLRPEIQSAIEQSTPKSIEQAVKNIAVIPEGSLGQTIQATLTDDIKNRPQEFHNKAMVRALKEVGGDVHKLTPEIIEKSYSLHADELATDIKSKFKEFYGEVTKEVFKEVAPESEFDPSRPTENGKSIIENMIDNPEETKAKLESDAEKLEKENPDWKDKAKDLFSKYGSKTLMILAFLGAILPGGSKILSKLAGLAGNVVAKVADVAAKVLQSFLGPIFKVFANLFKKFKWVFITIAAIILIMIILWIYRTLMG